jgi:hypothetical protein
MIINMVGPGKESQAAILPRCNFRGAGCQPAGPQPARLPSFTSSRLILHGCIDFGVA